MASKKKTNSRRAARGQSKKRTAAKKKRLKAVVKRPQAVAASDAARIIAAIKQIPRRKVCPYGVVAEVAGLPRRARLVGTVLRQMPASKNVPWFRVINASGRISFPQGSDSYARQRKLLEAEGVDFAGGRVDLDHYGWPSREKLLDELLWGPPQ